MNASIATVTTENLPIFMCLLIDSPSTGIDCATKYSNSNNSVVTCIQCQVRADYLSGESVNDYRSIGHKICVLLWILTILVGTVGTLGNLLIITVLNRRIDEGRENKGIDFLLTVLAFFDAWCFVMSMFASTGHVMYFGNWTGRGQTLLYFYYLSWILLLFGRSASQFMTVAITIERYLVLAFPFRTSSWFSSVKTKLLTIVVVLYAILLAIPRSTSRYVADNIYGRDHHDIPSLRDLTYVIRSTTLTHFWYRTLKSVHYQVDFWLPLPLLLFFNFLSFWQVRKMTERRKLMNTNQEKAIQAVNMFFPAVFVLLCCNLVPITMFAMVHFCKILYREVYMATILSISLNSCLNFLIYYLRGSNFRKETCVVLRDMMCFSSNGEDICDGLVNKDENTNAGGSFSSRINVSSRLLIK